MSSLPEVGAIVNGAPVVARYVGDHANERGVTYESIVVDHPSGFQVYVLGNRVATLKTARGAARRAIAEVTLPRDDAEVTEVPLDSCVGPDDGTCFSTTTHDFGCRYWTSPRAAT